MKRLRPRTSLVLATLLAGTVAACVVAVIDSTARTPHGVAAVFTMGGILGFVVVAPVAAGEAFRAPLVRWLGQRAWNVHWHTSLLMAVALGYFLASLRHRTLDVFTWISAVTVMLGASVKILLSTIYAHDG